MVSELGKLQQYLAKKGYFFERKDTTISKALRGWYAAQFGRYSGEGEWHQIIVFRDDGTRAIWFDVICHWGSYGWEKGLLEIAGPEELCNNSHDCVEGWLTAQDIINRLEALGNDT